MNFRSSLGFTGLLLYLLFFALAHANKEKFSTIDQTLSSSHFLLLFLLGFFLPGLLTGLVWTWKIRYRISFTRKILFVLSSIFLYGILIIAGLENPLALMLWACMNTCVLFLLHHYLLSPTTSTKSLPGILLLTIFATTLSLIPIVLSLHYFRLTDIKLISIGFLSFPLWGFATDHILSKYKSKAQI